MENLLNLNKAILIDKVAKISKWQVINGVGMLNAISNFNFKQKNTVSTKDFWKNSVKGYSDMGK